MFEQQFLEKVSIFKEQSLYGKEEAKRKKQATVLKLLDQCKEHGGPVTQTCVHLLEKWNIEQLRLETLFLKNTLSSHLKIKHVEVILIRL